MSSWTAWLSEQTSGLSATLSEGFKEFSEQLSDESTAVRGDVTSAVESANAKLGEVGEKLSENLKSALEASLNEEGLVDAEVADHTLNRLADISAAGKSAVTEQADRVGVMLKDLGVEGALEQAEGAAQQLLARSVRHPPPFPPPPIRRATPACSLPPNQADRLRQAMPSAQRGSAPSAGPHAASGSGASSAARLEERIRGMESRRESFLQPVADAADFDAWSEHFELRGEAGDVETLLEQREALRAMHARLVPDELSEESFWRRYFYARQALEAQEARRLELLRRSHEPPPAADRQLSWDDDDDGAAASPPAGAAPRPSEPSAAASSSEAAEAAPAALPAARAAAAAATPPPTTSDAPTAQPSAAEAPDVPANAHDAPPAAAVEGHVGPPSPEPAATPSPDSHRALDVSDPPGEPLPVDRPGSPPQLPPPSASSAAASDLASEEFSVIGSAGPESDSFDDESAVGADELGAVGAAAGAAGSSASAGGHGARMQPPPPDNDDDWGEWE